MHIEPPTKRLLMVALLRRPGDRRRSVVRAIRCVTSELSLLIAAACCRFPITISLPLGLLTPRNNCCHFSSVIAVMSSRDRPSQKSSLKAISWMSPPHSGHAKGNSSPTRAMSFAQACPGGVVRAGLRKFIEYATTPVVIPGGAGGDRGARSCSRPRRRARPPQRARDSRR